MALTRAKLEELIAAGEIEVGGGGVNANILHNWDWRTPVNQRGVSGTISTAGYFYDRWMLNSGSVTTNGSYLTIAAGAVVEQRIEGNLLAGETVTVSVMVGGTVFSGTGTFPTSAGTASVTITGWGTATLGYVVGYMYVRLSPTAASNIESVKLELGTIGTLAYDPPMDHAVELPKCQRYYRVFPTGTKLTGIIISGVAYCQLQLSPPMRSIPTITSASPMTVCYSGTSGSFSPVSSGSTVTRIEFGFAVGGGGPSSAELGGIVTLSADL